MKFISAAAVDSFSVLSFLNMCCCYMKCTLCCCFFVLKIKGRINVIGMLNWIKKIDLRRFFIWFCTDIISSWLCGKKLNTTFEIFPLIFCFYFVLLLNIYVVVVVLSTYYNYKLFLFYYWTYIWCCYFVHIL
jgi:hypothetical protein